jgi:zinc protease
MKNISMKCFFCFALFLISSVSGCSSTKIVSHPSEIKLDSISFTRPKPESWQLKNGLKVIYTYDPELPWMYGGLYFRGGSLYDPSNMVGLSEAMGSGIREGGIAGKNVSELDLELDNLGASIESGSSSEYGNISFFCLEKDFNNVFGIFSEVVLNPGFDQERLNLWKKISTDSIARRKDDPGKIAGSTLSKLLYGDSPYSRDVTLQSIASIKQRDLIELHKQLLVPDRAYLTIAGSVPKDQVVKLVEQKFSNWEGEGSVDLSFPKVARGRKFLQTPVYVLEKDLHQATVVIGHLGPSRFSDEMFPISSYNYILGYGGFDSILFSEIRTKRGLAYDVSGGLSSGPVAGVFEVNLQTKNESVAEAVKASIAEVKKTITNLPDKNKLQGAKSAISNGYVFKFASSEKINEREALLEVLGYPKDYDDTYLKKVSKVSAEDVLKAGGHWVKPDELVIVVVGGISKEKLAEELGPQFDVRSFSFDTEPRF